MGHKVKLLVPTDNREDLVPIMSRICGRWGGVTLSDATGWWWSDYRNELIEDKLSVLECSLGLWDQAARDWWSELSEDVREQWDEECVMLSVVEEHAILVYASGNQEVIGG